jgi:hypothetical protein
MIGRNLVHPVQYYRLLVELERIQTHMTQMQLLWVEVGAHAVRERSERCGGGVGEVRMSRGTCVV